VSDGALVQTYDQETGTAVLSIQFSPNGQLFGYGRDDATVVVARNPFTVEDRDPPDTFIVEGPEEGALVCREPVRFRWRGTDDATPPDQLYFRWRLDGGDWSDWTRDTSVELTGLSDGEHTFEVQARDLADRIDETPASRTFRFRTTTRTHRKLATSKLMHKLIVLPFSGQPMSQALRKWSIVGKARPPGSAQT
jgi:hypothetical protein